MFQFWRYLTNQMTHHAVGRPVADHPLSGKRATTLWAGGTLHNGLSWARIGHDHALRATLW